MSSKKPSIPASPTSVKIVSVLQSEARVEPLRLSKEILVRDVSVGAANCIQAAGSQESLNAAPLNNEDENSDLPIMELGAVNHFSIELIWEEALKRAKEKGRLGPIKVTLESKHKTGSDWATVYKGMAKKSITSDLLPKTKYQFRYKLEHKNWSSDWSAIFVYQTTREPLYAENLHMAIKRMDLEQLEEILKSGDVSPDVQNEDGFTALQAAAKKPFLEGMEMLLAYGADINFKNQAGKTALMIACTANIKESVQLLRRHDADYYACDNGGCTAIHWAVDVRNVILLEWMAQDGADFNIHDKGNGGWTPLIRCANMHGDRNIGLTLMMNGADIHATDNNGSTALHHAVMRKQFDLCQVLMQRRADPLVPNKERTTPWQIAQSSDDKKRIAQMMEPYVEECKKMKKKQVAALAAVSSQTNNNSTVTPSASKSKTKPQLKAMSAVQ